jgi:lipopolysaccharide heptosyltransferase I
MPPLHELTARRILLIKPSALGDIVHTLPVLSALRQRFPQAHIAWLVNRAYEPLLAGHPDLNATIPFDRNVARSGVLGAARATLALARRLRQERFDLVVDLQGLLRSGVMSLATGAARRVGLGCSREGARWFHTDVIPSPPRRAVHAVDRLWCAAEALGAGQYDKRFHVPVAPTAAAWASEQLAAYPRPWLMLAAGSRWLTKRWPTEHFAVLARRSQSVFGGSVVLVGAADEADLSRAVRRQLTGPSLDLTGKTSLPQLAAVLARADVMLANDTGPLHLAVALGRPVVAPYTCTQVALTGPYGQAQRAVETRVWCSGSLCRHCSRLECMAELTPARLWPPLQEVLLSWHCRSRSA